MADETPADAAAGDRMTVQFDVILPASITALAKLPGELSRAFERSGLTCSEPAIKQKEIADGD